MAIGYKLFEQNIETGELYPLFIDKKTITPINKWVNAEIITNHPGFAHRPGWHVGTMPSAPWLMSLDGTYKSQRGKKYRRVWCSVEYNSHTDYTDTVSKLPKKCFTDRLPTNGFYKFRESAGRDWIITDRICVVRILTYSERMHILNALKFDEHRAFAPYYNALKKRSIKND